MTKRNSEVTDGDWDFQWEQIKADQQSDSRDWDDMLRDEYLSAEFGINSPEDVEIAATANEISKATGDADPEGDRELEELLRLAGVTPRSQNEGAG